MSLIETNERTPWHEISVYGVTIVDKNGLTRVINAQVYEVTYGYKKPIRSLSRPTIWRAPINFVVAAAVPPPHRPDSPLEALAAGILGIVSSYHLALYPNLYCAVLGTIGPFLSVGWLSWNRCISYRNQLWYHWHMQESHIQDRPSLLKVLYLRAQLTGWSSLEDC